MIDGINTHTLSNPLATWQITLPYVSTDPHNALDDASDLTAIHLEFLIDYDDVKRGWCCAPPRWSAEQVSEPLL